MILLTDGPVRPDLWVNSSTTAVIALPLYLSGFHESSLFSIIFTINISVASCCSVRLGQNLGWLLFQVSLRTIISMTSMLDMVMIVKMIVIMLMLVMVVVNIKKSLGKPFKKVMKSCIPNCRV